MARLDTAKLDLVIDAVQVRLLNLVLARLTRISAQNVRIMRALNIIEEGQDEMTHSMQDLAAKATEVSGLAHQLIDLVGQLKDNQDDPTARESLFAQLDSVATDLKAADPATDDDDNPVDPTTGEPTDPTVPGDGTVPGTTTV